MSETKDAERIEALEAELSRAIETRTFERELRGQYEEENERLRAYIQSARKALPPDPSLNEVWSQCIAILDEALAPPKDKADD